MASQEKSVRLRHRGTEELYQVMPGTWQKMQDQGKGEAYEEITQPAVPKEVAKQLAANKTLAGSQTPASDKHGLQTNSDRLPVENAG